MPRPTNKAQLLSAMQQEHEALDKALKYISRHKKVWKTTGSEIARHYLAQLQEAGSGKKRAKAKIA